MEAAASGRSMTGPRPVITMGGVLPVDLAQVEHNLLTRRGVGDDDLPEPGVGVPELGGVAAGAQRREGSGLRAVKQVLVERCDIEVQIEGEPVAIAVSVQGLAAAEGVWAAEVSRGRKGPP